MALQKNPKFAKALVREGHEIAAHGYRWLDIWEYTPEQEREYINKTLKVLKEVSGEMPVGAYFGRGTPQTHAKFPEIWEELGEEFLWSSEVYNDDVPYWLDLPWEEKLPESERKGMLLIPYNVCPFPYLSHPPYERSALTLYANCSSMRSMIATMANSTCRPASVAAWRSRTNSI